MLHQSTCPFPVSLFPLLWTRPQILKLYRLGLAEECDLPVVGTQILVLEELLDPQCPTTERLLEGVSEKRGFQTILSTSPSGGQQHPIC